MLVSIFELLKKSKERCKTTCSIAREHKLYDAELKRSDGRNDS